MMAQPYDVFISYSFKDKVVADEIYRTLEAQDVTPWMAPYSILPGAEWAAAIIQGIAQCRIFVLVFSDASNRSDDVLRELRYAASLELPILPYRVQDVPLSPHMEYFIGNSHWLNAFGGQPAEHLSVLLDSIQRLLAARGKVLPTSTPTGSSALPVAEQSSGVNPSSAPRHNSPLPGMATNQPESPTIDQLFADPHLLRQTEVGSYCLEQPLGSGGTGVVFRARNRGLGNEVCVKLFYPMEARLQVLLGAMRRGMRGLAALNHPFVIRLLDFGSVQVAQRDLLYLAMELVSGQTLMEWTMGLEGSPQAVPNRLRMAHRLASAMAAVHESKYLDEAGFEATGVLHGDLKPANILVRRDGSPVLLDFMMADLQRLVEPRWRAEDTRSSEPATWAFGTPGYMAPEQEDHGIVRVTTDVYGLGVTLLLVFFPTHFGEQEGRPMWPGALRSAEDGLNPLRGLLRAMTHRAPEQRPDSMRGVCAALEDLAASLNLSVS